jgi:excisionase family DNA binding protein
VVGDSKNTTGTDARPQDSETNTPERVKERRTDFLTARQLAQILQISESTIHRLRRAGRIPAVLVTEKLIRFNLKDVSRALRPKGGSHDRDDLKDDGRQQDQEESPQLSFDDLYSDFREE